MKKLRGHPTESEAKTIRTQCEKAFNDGLGVLSAAEELNLNKNTVSSYYTEFREKLFDKMDKDFVLEQKTAKQMSIKKLEDRIKEVKNIKKLIIENIKLDEPTIYDKLLKCEEIGASLEQARYSLEMTPTIDISIDKIIEESREEIEELSNNNKRSIEDKSD